MTGDMRDPGHGASRIRQRPVGQRWPGAQSSQTVDKPPPPDITCGSWADHERATRGEQLVLCPLRRRARLSKGHSARHVGPEAAEGE